MLAGGAEELATSQAQCAFHALTAVNAAEFHVTIDAIQSIHNFKGCCFHPASCNAKSGDEKDQHIFVRRFAMLS
jgi:hypothetical protein